MRIFSKRNILVTAGVFCTVLGLIGIFVPILPTTPFLLLAAACFSRSSERFYRLLPGNRFSVPVSEITLKAEECR
jgi:uncharacterized membrane protein YbaN (DUF454 family)